LREGHDEIERAAKHKLPVFVSEQDIRGELHAHSISGDGIHSIEQMAAAAKAKGYEYIGITDHSQSLKIARGVPAEELWQQIRFIDKLNARLSSVSSILRSGYFG
jgi:DNA polymerase (family 10)